MISFLQDTKFENQIGTRPMYVHETTLTRENLNVPNAILEGKKLYVVSRQVTINPHPKRSFDLIFNHTTLVEVHRDRGATSTAKRNENPQ